MERYQAEFAEEADRAREKAIEILGDRPNCTTKAVRGSAKGVLRHVCAEYNATLIALGGTSSSRFLGMMAGETASSLLHDADRSVLFARPRGATMASEAGAGRVGRLRALAGRTVGR